MKKITLIAGASGLVGGACLQLLLENEKYSKIISIGRRKLELSHPKLQQEVIDFDQLDNYAGLFEVDHIYCCLGTTIKKAKSKENFRKVDFDYPLKMAELGAAKGVSVYSIVTALGANANSSIFYNKVKGEIENSLKTMKFEKTNILQPSILLGERQESRIGEAIGQAVFRVINPLFVGGLKQFKGITGKQVAKAMVNLTFTGSSGYHKYKSDKLWGF